MGHDTRLRLVRSNRVPPEDVAQLQAFADQVEDEAHWQRLLATAQTDDSRAELETVVGPMLKFRQPRCHTPECDSGEPPLFQPVLIVRKRPQDQIWAPLEFRVCDTCRAKITVGDLLTVDIWQQIVQQCLAAGEPIPVREMTSLMFDRVQ
jgi:hypothetical protein